jgi:hypothetical protein
VRSIRPKECAFVADRPSSVECSGLLGSCGVTQVAAATRARPPSAPHKQSGRRARPIRTRIHKRINVRFFSSALISLLARSHPVLTTCSTVSSSSSFFTRRTPARFLFFRSDFIVFSAESEQPRHSSAAARASSLTSPCRPERHRVFRRYKRRSKISCVKIPRRRDTFPVKIMQPR